MIDIRDLAARPEVYQASFASRGLNIDIDKILQLIESKKQLVKKLETLRAAKNQLSKVPPQPESIAKSKDLSREIAECEKLETELAEQEITLLQTLPNLNLVDTPINLDPEHLVIEREVGDKPQFDFPILDHQALGEQADLIDTAAGAKVSGSRFWYLKNDLVLLQFSLIQYILKLAKTEGFAPMLVPQLVGEAAMFGTGFLPTDEKELYRVNPETDNLYLIGTSEVPLVSYHADEILDLPEANSAKRYIGFSSCFRREAGASGKDTRGILRGHQFDKLELVSFCRPENSSAEHAKILALQEKILLGLGLAYRVLNIVSSDLGSSAAKKYDIEAWVPSQQTYREVTSTSNCTDYQARRLKIRYRNAEGKTSLVHTLNGTAGAMSRLMLVIMENYQTADGRVKVPPALKAMGLLGDHLGE